MNMNTLNKTFDPQTLEVDFDPGSHTMLLTHGARTAKAIIFVHGYPSAARVD